MSDHAALAPALVDALADLTTVARERSADTGSFAYRYADLADVVETTRPVLAAHGLAAVNWLHAYGDGLACTVTIWHRSGERWDVGPFPFPHGKDAQATGSMVTYHRRYALLAALGMAAGGEDDDGARAQPRVAPRPATVTPRALAKSHLLELADNDADQARQARREIGLDGHAWGNDPAAEIEALYLEWVNAEPEQ